MYPGIAEVFRATVVAGSVAACMAATSAIGTVSTRGIVRVNEANVTGGGNVSDGSVIETEQAASELQLRDGVRLTLGAGSRGRVYSNRLVLDRGQGQVAGSASFRVEAAKLRVSPAQPSSTAVVSVLAAGKVHVSALAGPVRVMNAQGLLLATVPPGRSLEFEPASGAAAPARLTGTLLRRENSFLMTDEMTGITAEIKGGGLERAAGQRVAVSGALDTISRPAAGTTQVIQAQQVQVITGAAPAKSVIAGVVVGGRGGN